MSNATTMPVRPEDHRQIKSEAAKAGKSMMEFVAIIYRTWRELPQSKRDNAMENHYERPAPRRQPA